MADVLSSFKLTLEIRILEFFPRGLRDNLRTKCCAGAKGEQLSNTSSKHKLLDKYGRLGEFEQQ